MTNPLMWGRSESGDWIDLSYVTDMTLSEDTLSIEDTMTAEGHSHLYHSYLQRYVLSMAAQTETPPELLLPGLSEYLSPDAMTYTAGDEPEMRAHP